MTSNQTMASQIVAAFRFLEDDLGFAVAQDTSSPRELYVTYKTDVAVVSIAVEVGSVPFVSVISRETGEGHGLVFLIRDQCPDEEARLAAITDFEQYLRKCADLLRRYGADLLAGDLSCVPRLRKLRAVHVRESNRAQFGTSTGETPRFDSRPTLTELFAGAANHGIHDARVYQAFWDYDYSLGEIGAFLGLATDAVQAMLDRWDRL